MSEIVAQNWSDLDVFEAKYVRTSFQKRRGQTNCVRAIISDLRYQAYNVTTYVRYSTGEFYDLQVIDYIIIYIIYIDVLYIHEEDRGNG